VTSRVGFRVLRHCIVITCFLVYSLISIIIVVVIVVVVVVVMNKIFVLCCLEHPPGGEVAADAGEED